MALIKETSTELRQYLDAVGYSQKVMIVSLFDAHQWFMTTYKIRVFPKQKTNGHFGVEFYEANPDNPVGQPFRRLCGNSAFTLNFTDFYEAIQSGMIFAFKEFLKIELPE